MRTKRISFIVNGQLRTLEVGVNWTLLKVLREVLGLTGTKHGCGTGECGACTVLLDGKPTLSCLVLAPQVDRRDVITIEGLAEGGKLHPLQEAFIEHHGMQCGFCTPGVLLSAKALLDNNPNPTKEDIMKSQVGNLCRCGNYQGIVKAILAASEKIRRK